MDTRSPIGVGLGGDGDEIEAIADVERAFGVKLDYADAHEWVTAGDVFAALRRALPSEELSEPDLWQRFAAALTDVTGVDPGTIEPESVLISQPLWARLSDVSAVVWIACAAFVGAGLLAAALF